MLNYSNVIENDKSYPGLQMREIKPVMKLIIRGKKRQFLSAVGKSLNLLLPNEANTSSRSDQLTALWLSPGLTKELLIDHFLRKYLLHLAKVDLMIFQLQIKTVFFFL